MSGPRQVVVIGGGIVGVCCALALRRDGHAVTVLDPTPGEGASKSNAGFISSGSCVPIATPGIVRRVPKMLLDPLAPLAVRWSYLPWIAPWLVRFVRASAPERVEAASVALNGLTSSARDAYASLVAGSPAARHIHSGGVLYVFQSDASFAGAEWGLDLRRRRGVEFEVLHGADIRDLEPALAPSVRHAVFYRKTQFVPDPRALVLALAEDFTRLGGTVVKETVTDVTVRARGPHAVETTGGRRDAEVLVLAAGAWSKRLAARLGARVPLDTERGYVVTLPRPGAAPKIPVLSGDYSFAITPMETGLRLSGTVELAGLHAPPNYARARKLIDGATRVLGAVDPTDATYAMAFRPSMPDSLPVLGPSPRVPSVFFAFGHGHIGLTCGAVTGQLVAEMVGERPTAIDLAPFRADRF